jgi:hypothetical protein
VHSRVIFTRLSLLAIRLLDSFHGPASALDG